MKSEVAELLEGSIQKWTDIIETGKEERGNEDCPLCELDCDVCPVAQETGQNYCNDTPYNDWMTHHTRVHYRYERTIRCDKCRQIAQAMLDFLVSLREE